MKNTMKQALEVLKKPWKAGPDGVADAIIALEEALAKQEQRSDSEQLGEPVAIVVRPGKGWNVWLSRLVEPGTALYTTPQQRKPLTDEQAHQTLLDMKNHIEKFGDENTTEQQLSAECIRFILERVAAHGIKE